MKEISALTPGLTHLNVAPSCTRLYREFAIRMMRKVLTSQNFDMPAECHSAIQPAFADSYGAVASKQSGDGRITNRAAFALLEFSL